MSPLAIRFLLLLLIIIPAALCSSEPLSGCRFLATAGADGEGGLSSPAGMALGMDGVLYVADEGNNRVVLFDSTGTFLSRIGTGGSAEGRFLSPVDLATEGLHLYVLDGGNERIQLFDRYEVFSDILFSREDGDIGIPSALAVDPFGRVYISDAEEDLVHVFRSFSGDEEMIIGGYGVEEGRFRQPAGIAVGRDRMIYICDRGNDRVQLFSPLGGYHSTIGLKEGKSRLSRPEGVAVGMDGTVYIADTGNRRIASFSRRGEFRGEISALPTGEQLVAPVDVVVSQSGILYISDRGSDRIHIFRCGGPHDDR